ncbi:39S ribosomal protein L15, mitochondrial [Portunus trituberculatus]|uniref:39S ribosomal protein L15, mitochondrial n=1 Tax=Portunus trituberculatus TaxID=210409 RepID=A0A5B7GNY9_PORTR|nr:39S ribosomal protein L15, mitochondrial [Portunus trituberculatus]
MRLSYAPLCLGKLQRMIDTGRLRTDTPTDITQLSATHLITVNPADKMGGVMLTDESEEAQPTLGPWAGFELVHLETPRTLDLKSTYGSTVPRRHHD